MRETKHQEVEIGRIEATVLGILLSGDSQEMYGLEILNESEGLLKRGSLYVTLQRMEEKRLVRSRQEARPKPEVGIPRRVYCVTGLGMSAFRRYQTAHKRFAKILATV
jgi:PadR family transcriptional regulator, regulatory protein PadR